MILLFIIILCVSVIASMLGQGGGVLYTPIQVWYGIQFQTAATTSLFLIMITSFSASLVYRKAHRIDWPMAITLELVTALGGFMGGLWSDWFSGATLSLVFALVVAFASIFMIGKWYRQPDCLTGFNKKYAWKRRVGEHDYCVNLYLGLPVSFVAGLASGLVGVGGGILKVPIMVLLLGIPMEIAVGSSAFMVGMTAFGGFTGHLIHGHWDWRMSLILGVAVFVGAQLGSKKSIGVDPKKLKKGFGWFLLVIAISMFIRYWI